MVARRDLWHNGWSFGAIVAAARGRVAAAPAVGAAMTRRLCAVCRRWRSSALCRGSCAPRRRSATPSSSSGATGGPSYAQQYAAWTKTLSQALRRAAEVRPARIVTCCRESPDAATAATAANVRRALRRRSDRSCRPDDLLFVVPDRPRHVRRRRREVQPGRARSRSRRNGRRCCAACPAGSSSSTPRPPARRSSSGWRAAPHRHLRDRLRRAAVRHGVSRVLHRALSATSRRHRQERPDLDLGGVRLGRRRGAALLPAARPARDRASAARRQRRRRRPRGLGAGRRRRGRRAAPTSSAGAAGAPPTDDVLVELLQRRASLVAEVEELQVKKAFMSPDEYAREFERIMLALARVGRDIRARNPS